MKAPECGLCLLACFFVCVRVCVCLPACVRARAPQYASSTSFRVNDLYGFLIADVLNKLKVS